MGISWEHIPKTHPMRYKSWSIFWVMTYDSTNHHDNWGILGIRLKIKFGKSAMILSSPTDHMNPYDTSVSA